MFFCFPLGFSKLRGFLFGSMGGMCILAETKQHAMHKDKRKKRLARKYKRKIDKIKIWATILINNNEFIKFPLFKHNISSHLDKNKTTLHNEEFVDIICKEWRIPNQDLNPI